MLLEEKHCLHKAHQDDTSSVSKKAAYNNICKTVQNRLRDIQDSWLSKKAEEIQSFADRKDMKKFHDALKTIYGPKSSGATPLLSADGMAEKLTELFQCMWGKEDIPQDFKDASTIHLYKRKGNPQVCETTEVSLSYQLLGRYWQNFY